jgi:hypothetical protein
MDDTLGILMLMMIKFVDLWVSRQVRNEGPPAKTRFEFDY